jgi:hypothetical protein
MQINKTTFVAVALGTYCAQAAAQGLVYFANSSAVITHIATNTVPGGPSTGQINGPPGTYFFALFVSPTGSVSTVTPDLAGWRLSQPPNGAIGTNIALGRFSGNEYLQGSAVADYPSAGTADFLVVGWSANIGPSWQAAQAWWNNGDPWHGSQSALEGWFGISDIARNVMLGGVTPVGTIFGTGPGQIPGFTLNTYVVPEPSVPALVFLGVATYVLQPARRRPSVPPTR